MTTEGQRRSGSGGSGDSLTDFLSMVMEIILMRKGEFSSYMIHVSKSIRYISNVFSFHSICSILCIYVILWKLQLCTFQFDSITKYSSPKATIYDNVHFFSNQVNIKLQYFPLELNIAYNSICIRPQLSQLTYTNVATEW